MQKDILIRHARQADYPTIYELIETAFKTAEHRDGTEQDFAVDLRAGTNYIPELELVAEIDSQLIGHIMLTKTYVVLPDGGRYDTLLLAPLSVLREYRNAGVGSALVRQNCASPGQWDTEPYFLSESPITTDGSASNFRICTASAMNSYLRNMSKPSSWCPALWQVSRAE